jgi:hypothetical protein
MGDLAPAGSRGVVVVDNFLSQTGRDTFKGENYTLQRNEAGDIAIASISFLMRRMWIWRDRWRSFLGSEWKIDSSGFDSLAN